MENDKLDQLAPTLFAEAKPSPQLRERVLAALPAPTPKPSALRWGLAGGGLVAAGVVAVQVRPHPRPAYADLQTAMTQINTAHWETQTTQWTSGKVESRTTEHFVNRAIPAMASREISGAKNRQPEQSLLTPAASLIYDSGRDVFLKDYPEPAETIRKNIQESFFPPAKTAPTTTSTSPYHWTPWEVEETQLEGKPVLRFHQECHYQSETYSSTLWAEAKTRRLVRRESEMAWTGYRTKTVATNFRYDVALPADAFTLSVPKGKSVFVNDHHFYPGARKVSPKEQEMVEIDKLLQWIDGGWSRRDATVFSKAFDFTYLPTLYNGIISPSPQKRAAQQEAYWRKRLVQAAKLRRRWDHWESSLVSVEQQPGVRIQGMPPFCLHEGDPAIWKAELAVRCDSKQGAIPIQNGTLHYTLWLRRVGGTFRVIYAELNDTLGPDAQPSQRLFD